MCSILAPLEIVAVVKSVLLGPLGVRDVGVLELHPTRDDSVDQQLLKHARRGPRQLCFHRRDPLRDCVGEQPVVSNCQVNPSPLSLSTKISNIPPDLRMRFHLLPNFRKRLSISALCLTEEF